MARSRAAPIQGGKAWPSVAEFAEPDFSATPPRVLGKHQNPWGQSSRHRRLNVQTSTSNARSPFRRKTVSPFDPTDFGASVIDPDYHVLGDRDYERTRISPSRGEKYFYTEAEARAAGWRRAGRPPWDWRRGDRLNTATRDAPRVTAGDRDACNIKGNISHNSGKHIYHVLGDRDYERTRISPSRGEKYFCTEAEARAAGWRREGR